MRSSEASGPIITLTTDFGYHDPFVGQIKGVILSVNPSVTIVDITHGAERHGIGEAAFITGDTHRFFPPGTIHVVVVDPGVGSSRKAIIVRSGHHIFVGPDNGVFSVILANDSEAAVVEIREDRYLLDRHSPTFQGRDVFAPAAAWLSRGVAVGGFGPSLKDPVILPIAATVKGEDGVTGAVMYIDGFGNAITNIRPDCLPRGDGGFHVRLRGVSVFPVTYYSEAAPGTLSCLFNSSGYLEIFVPLGSAAELFAIRRGDEVSVTDIEST